MHLGEVLLGGLGVGLDGSVALGPVGGTDLTVLKSPSALTACPHFRGGQK